MAFAIDTSHSFADPPEHTFVEKPEDEEVYKIMREHFGSRLNGLDDDVLPRFVRGYSAEENRVQVTTDRLQFFLDKRAEWDFDRLFDKPWDAYEECANAWQIFIYGQNKFGHPIVYDRCGSADLPLLRSALPPDDPNKMTEYRYRIQLLIQKYKKALRLKYGKMLYLHDWVFDLSGFTASHFSGSDIRNAVAKVIGEEQHLFPETCHRVYIINAPLIFRAAWKVISYFVDPITYEKVKVLGPGFLSEMTKEIDLGQIPKQFGGKGQWPIRYGAAHTDDIEEILGSIETAPVVETESKDPEDDHEKSEPSLSFNPEQSQSESHHSLDLHVEA